MEVFDLWHSLLCSRCSCLIASEVLSEKDCNCVGLRTSVTLTVRVLSKLQLHLQVDLNNIAGT